FARRRRGADPAYGIRLLALRPTGVWARRPRRNSPRPIPVGGIAGRRRAPASAAPRDATADRRRADPDYLRGRSRRLPRPATALKSAPDAVCAAVASPAATPYARAIHCIEQHMSNNDPVQAVDSRPAELQTDPLTMLAWLATGVYGMLVAFLLIAGIATKSSVESATMFGMAAVTAIPLAIML